MEGLDGDTTIVDVTGKAWVLSGGAVLTNSTAPFGTTSLQCTNGTALAEVAASSVDFAYGTGDFTVECFFNPSNNNAYQSFIQPNNGQDIHLVKDHTNLNCYNNGLTNGIIGASNNVWHHGAFTRASGVTRMFLDGVSSPADTSLDNYGVDKMRIGLATRYLTPFYGFIKDVRVTKGVARYTGNFTPPTGPFPNS
jgi:hypothetical protein